MFYGERHEGWFRNRCFQRKFALVGSLAFLRLSIMNSVSRSRLCEIQEKLGRKLLALQKRGVDLSSYPANREKGAAAFVPPFVDVTNGILNLLQTLFEVKHIPLRLWDIHEDM